VKPQVLQFLLDLVEVYTEASANSLHCASSTLLDDERLNEATMNDKTADCAAIDTSLGCDQLCAASDPRKEHTAASKSADGDGDSQESNPGDTGRCSVLGTNGINRNPGLSSKELHVQTTSEEVSPNITGNECCMTKSGDDFTSPATSECELKSSVHNRPSAETSAGPSKANLQQQGCCMSDDAFSFGSERFSCRQCCVKFENAAEQEEHVCDRTLASDYPTAPDNCPALKRQRMSSVFKDLHDSKTDQHSQDDSSVQEDTVGDIHDDEHAFLTATPAKDVTWDTLIGTESPDEHLLSVDEQTPIKRQEYECSSNEISAASSSLQPALNDNRSRTISSSSNSNRKEHVVSASSFSNCSMSRLLSNAWNALLLHIGLDCVSKFNQSLLRYDSGCDEQPDSNLSKSDEDEGPCVQGVDDPQTTYDGDADEENEDDQSEAERQRSLTCFYCLQRFADAQTLQTHFERTHCQQQSLPGGFQLRPDRHQEPVVDGSSGLSSVSAVSSALASIVSGHATSAAGAWNRLPDSTSSYFGGISPEILGLLSAIPPELMLPHVYPGSILPPAMMMMMMASPFVDCPSSPLPNSLAALADPRACLLPSSATESQVTYDDPTSLHQQSKRARTRINDSQLAVLRARFDINGPPNDDEIASIGFEIGLPSKVVKHWFRNTLFKERQRCKDSPYNFNVPPAGDPPSSSVVAEKVTETAIMEVSRQSADDDKDYERHDIRSDSSSTSMPATDNGKLCSSSLTQPSLSTAQCLTAVAAASETPYFPRGCYFGVPYHAGPPTLPLLPSVAPVAPATVSGAQIVNMTSMSIGMAAHHPPTTAQSRGGGGGGHGKRASRTHFSDEQVRTLQEHFERNAYPRDDELESL